MSARPALSVVIPVRNEEAVLPAFHRRLVSAIDATHGGFEIVYVDDGSTDRTRALLELASGRDMRVGGQDVSCELPGGRFKNSVEPV